MALVAKGQQLAFRLPGKEQRDRVLRQQRGGELHVLNTVKTVARRQRGGVMHHPVELRHARQQRLYGEMSLKPEQVRIKIKGYLQMLWIGLEAPDFRDLHETTPVAAQSRACSCC